MRPRSPPPYGARLCKGWTTAVIIVTATAVAAILFAATSFFSSDGAPTAPTPSHIRRVMANLCMRYGSADELSAVTWSHRGALAPATSIDASRDVTRQLLARGIANFDVDIVAVSSSGNNGNSNGARTSLVVSHPARLQRTTPHVHQNVSAFLSQVGAAFFPPDAPAPRQPLVTIEPKFTDPVLIEQLVREVVRVVGGLTGLSWVARALLDAPLLPLL